MSKHRLLLEDEYEFVAYGMSCHLKDYRVAWLMNKSIRMHFSRGQLDLQGKGGLVETFSRFVSTDEDSRLKYVLLSNQNEDVYLLKDWKQFDFFLLVEGYIDIFDAEGFMSNVQSIEGIQYIAELDKDIFSKIQYDLFEE